MHVYCSSAKGWILDMDTYLMSERLSDYIEKRHILDLAL